MNKKERFYLLVIIIGLPLFIYVFFHSKNQSKLYNRLDTESMSDTAFIVRDFIGAKRKLYFEYTFKVEHEEYNGFIKYSPGFGSMEIGDKYLVEYLPEYPDDVNRIKRDKFNQLVKVK
ncbi:MAG: hypothetical protein K9H49_14700 [Bacteroidales bacterium]|nr:hypothetical protein [Bacteroidales bacterium]MCF8390550.1 hypothetical protein [Bacteroidales bacterium]